MTALAQPVTTRQVGTAQRILTLSLLLGRPARSGRAALVLPIVAFAVTTALLLVVVGGTGMFLAVAGTQPDTGFIYSVLSVLALVLLTVPLVTLGAAAARLSSRRRNDRLATLRLLGATSGEVSILTIIESTFTALVGAVAGFVLYLAILPLVGLLPFFGGPVGAAAVWAGPLASGVVIVAVTVLAAVSATASLRRVQLTPLGVRRRTEAPPRKLAHIFVGAALVVLAVVVVANFGAAAQLLGPIVSIAVLVGLFAGVMALVNLVGAPLVAARGRAMARSAKTPAKLIAGRELAAHAPAAWRRVSGISMISFIAVIGGVGMALADMGTASTAEDFLFADMRTGVLVTLGVGFLLLACSVGVTQAASVLEDRELIVGLDRLGMPPVELARARSLTVMVPLRWAAVGGAALGGALALPLMGMAILVAPLTVLTVAATFVLGFGVVWVALQASAPLVTAIRRGGTAAA